MTDQKINHWNDLIIPDNVVWQSVDEDIVLFDSNNGNYFSLDEIASEVWRNIHHKKPFDSVVEELMKKYHADSDLITGDISRFVDDTIQKGLLTVNDGENE